jgi:hypothetical protein
MPPAGSVPPLGDGESEDWSGGAGVPPREPPEAPGLFAQFGTTRDSAKRLVTAHVELAKAEAADIGDATKKIAAMAGLAIAAGIAAALLLSVGLPLFLGEWIFGSIGWGLLHGLLLLSAVIVAAALLAVDIPATRVAGTLLLAVLVGVIAALVFAFDLTNRAWGLVGDSVLPSAAPDIRPLATALVILPIVGMVIAGLLAWAAGLRRGDRGAASGAAIVPAALYIGWLSAFLYAYGMGLAWFDWLLLGVFAGGAVVAGIVLWVVGRAPAGGALVTGISAGAVAGVLLALLTAVAFGPRVGVAMGVTVGLVTWIAGMAAAIASQPPDMEALKNKFIPQKSIDMTKETMEWARERMPLSRKS